MIRICKEKMISVLVGDEDFSEFAKTHGLQYGANGSANVALLLDEKSIKACEDNDIPHASLEDRSYLLSLIN